MNKIEFDCAKCGASLKVRAMLAGRTVQCPRCAEKTPVPRPGAEVENAAPPPESPPSKPTPTPPAPQMEAPASAGTPKETEKTAANTPEPEAPTPKPTPPAESPPPPETPAPQPAPAAQPESVDVSEYTRRIETLETELEEARARAADAVEKLDAAKAQAEEAEASAGLDPEALEEEVRVRYEAELKAARATITDLQKKLSASYEQHVAAAGQPEVDASAVPAEQDLVDPDALLSDMHAIKFGKYLRGAILLHAAVILITSIGYFIRLAQREPPAEDKVAETAAEAPGAAQPAPPAPEAEPEPEAPAPAPAETTPDRPKTELEERVESLPETGEAPAPSRISLDEDL